MQRFNNKKRHGFGYTKQGQRAILAAAMSTMAFAGCAWGQSTFFFDTNGATANFGSPTTGAAASWGVWNATTTNWSSSSGGTVATQAWTPGSLARFVSADTTAGATGTLLNQGGARVILSDVESVAGLFFQAGFTTIGGTGSSYGLNFGSNAFTITNAVNQKQIIAVPIIGSGDMTLSATFNGTSPIDLAGDLSQFTGNIFVNNNAPGGPSSANAPQLQLDSAPGDATKTISLDQWTQLQNNNQITDNGRSTANSYTIPNNIVLNYKGVANNTSNTIGCSAGPSGTEKFATYSGNISSPAGVTTNLIIGGPNGCTILSGNNTYNGTTTVNNSATTGMFRIGNDHALPATTGLIFASGGPMDLNGHNISIASLSTTNNNDTATTDGNIYNMFASSGSETPASITLTPAGTTSTTFKGDIGVTQNSTTFFTNAPNAGNVSVGKNISLTLNGPTGGGTNKLTLAPTSNEQNGNEYTGTTTVNNNAILVMGRTNGFAGAYTVTGGGNVTINSGGTLAGVPTDAVTYAGGFQGNVELKSGATLSPGGAGATGNLSSNNLTIDAGANLNFDFGSNSTLFDALTLNGGLTIDTSGNSILNLGMATGASFITPGTYTLITAGGISTAGSGSGTLLFANSTTDTILNGESIHLQSNGNSFQVVVSASAVQWDPSGTGAANLAASQKPFEGGGVWTDGSSTFVNYASNPATEYTWNNADAKDVIIGNDANQTGGDITLGSNITVGKLTFGPIFQTSNYRIADNGSGHTLTINGGVTVTNTAASPTTPSAEIDVPIVLGADQTWNVDPGQFLDIKGQLNGGATTLTKTGTGVVFFEHSGGSLNTLNANAGVVLLGAADALGSATMNLNGGGVQWAVTGTATNPISIGTNGGSLGATTGFTVTLPANFTTTNKLTVIGTGTTVLSGNLSISTLSTAMGSTGALVLSGTNNIGTFTSTGGTALLGGNNTIGLLAQSAGTSQLVTSTNNIATLALSGGTTVLATDGVSIGTIVLSGGTLQLGAGGTSGSLPAGLAITTSPNAGATTSGTLAFNRSDTYTFTNSLNGASLSVQQSGTGTTIMAEINNTVVGTSGTGINSGTLQLGINNPLGVSTLTLTGPSAGIAALNLAGFNQTVQGLRSAGTSHQNELITNDQAGASTLTVANTGAAEYDGAISGNLSVAHTGTATETLAGAISCINLINAGNGQLIATGTITANVTNSDGGVMTVSGLITGNANVANLGSSSLNLSGANNDFTGSVTVAAGTLSVGTLNALGTPGPLGNPSAGNATISMGGNGTTGILDYEGSASVTFARPMSMAANGQGALRINIGTASVTIPAETMSGAGGFEKLGAGTVTIVGTQSYGGLVTLVRGNLNVDTLANIGQESALGTGSNSATVVFGDGSGNSATLSFNSATPQSTNRPISENQSGGPGINIMSGDASAPGAIASSNLTLTGGIDLTNAVSATGGTITFGGAGMITASGPISGALGHVFVGISTTGDPSLVGVGTTVLAGSNTYGGGTYIRQGTLVVSDDTNLGAAAASLNFAGVGTQAGTLQLAGTVTSSRPIVFSQASTATAAINTGAFNGTFGPASGAGSWTKYGSGNLGVGSIRTPGVSIAEGTASIAGPRSASAASMVSSLTIAGSSGAWTSTLNLGSNDLVLDYTGTSPLTTIQDQLTSGRSGGSWTGHGITSSAAAAAVGTAHPTALGYGESAAVLGSSGGTFDGLSVDSTAVLVRYTYSGDANLDGTVDTLDFNALAGNFGGSGKVWTQADFNYDGVVDTLDFNNLAANFGQQLATPDNLGGGGGGGGVGALVPEPTLGLIVGASALLMRRRRHRG